MPSYTLEIEAFGVFATNMPSLEIWEDGVLDSTHPISSNGSTFSATINYGGSLPASLAFTFNDGFAANGRTIEIRSVKINNQYVNTGNYLSSDSLTKGQSATVDIDSINTDDSDFIFDSSDPAASEFTTSATETFTAGNDIYRRYDDSDDEVFDMLGGSDYAHLGSGDDKINGGAGDDNIRGGAGTDLLYGGADNDRIYGGDDNDTIYGGTGNDRLHGEGGDDEIHGGDGDDNLVGHAGDDVITGGDGEDKLNGGSGEDYLFGGADDDTLVGGADNDTLDGGDGNDIAYGSSGVDYIDGGDGDDILVGGSGNDVINGGNDDDIIYGQQDDDELYGSNGVDYVNGGDGDDSLSGDAGDDVLDGGADEDTVSYISASSSVTADLGVENHALDFAGGNDTVNLSGLGLNTASGSRVTVEFWMEWDGTNSVMPFGFNSYDLWFSGGNFGFNNNSSLVYGISSAGLLNTAVHVAAVFVDSNTLDSTLYINGVEQVLTVRQGSVNNGAAQITTTPLISGYGSSAGYKFDGTIDDLRIWNDERTSAEINQYMNYSITTPQTDLEANYTFESIATGAGGVIDSSGNANHGTLSGMTTGNQITWNNSGVSNGYASGGGDNDIIQNIENLIGSTFDDTLSGDLNDNIIEGREGNDTIFGDDGDDTIDGGSGTDTVSYALMDSGVTVDLSITTAQNTIGAGIDTINNVENIIGSAFDDILSGGAGNSIINGGIGADTLYAQDSSSIDFTSITGKVLWLDAADSSTIIDDDGDNAGTGTGGANDGFDGDARIWTDKSGLGNDVSTSAGRSPIYNLDAQNGLNSLTFDGGNDELAGTATVNGSQITIFAVYEKTANGSGRSDVIDVGTNSPLRTTLGVKANDTPTAITVENGSADFNDYAGSYNQNQYYVNTLIHDGTQFTGFIDGVQQMSLATFNRQSSTAIHVGNDSTGGDHFSGNISEIILYDRLLTTSERETVENHLMQKWQGVSTGSTDVNIISGGDGLDTFYGSDGLDTFLFEAASAFNDVDIIANYHKHEGDILDLSDVLSGQSVTSVNIDLFVQVTSNEGVRVDTTGSGNFGAATQIASFSGSTVINDALTMFDDGNIIV